VARSRLLLAAALAHRHLEAQAGVDPLRVLQERSGPHCGTRMRGEGRGPHPKKWPDGFGGGPGFERLQRGEGTPCDELDPN